MKKIFITLLTLAGIIFADDSTCQSLCSTCMESESGICVQINTQCNCNEYVELAATDEEINQNDSADEQQATPIKHSQKKKKNSRTQVEESESSRAETPIIDLGDFDTSSDSREYAEYSAENKKSEVALTNPNAGLIAGIVLGLSALIAMIIILSN